MSRLIRFGDTNMEYGGGFYAFDGWPNYASCVRVDPCSDAGGPDNQFWVEVGNVVLERPKIEIERALASIGMDDIDEWRRLSRAARRHATIEAVMGHYGMEADIRVVVQIGKDDPYFTPGSGWNRIEPDVILRAGSGIENYARKIFKE